MRFEQLIPLLMVTALVFAACNRDAEEPSETTVTPAATTATTATTATPAADAGGSAGDTTVATEPAGSDPGAASEEGGATTTVTTTEVVAGLPAYEVVHRMIEDDRETLVVVVEPGTYSNVQLENLVYDIVDRFAPSAAIVVDDREVADLAVLGERTEEQQARLDSHTFLHIEGGVEVTFYGPYADFPGLTVGS